MAVRARPDNLSLEEPSAPVARRGEDGPLEELWGHHAELQAVCLRMVGDPVRAEDLVQETYLRALQQTRDRRLDRRDSFGPWLATVARRRAIDEMRWRGRQWEQAVCLESRAATGTADDPVEQVLQQELFDRIRVALGGLSTRERQLLLRQVTHGLTLAELADEEGASVASVRSVLSRARGKLRTALERGGPLGAAPAPRWVVAARERLHRLAARVEGAMPSLVGGGAHVGDVMAAAIAAVVMLLGSAVAPVPAERSLNTIAAIGTFELSTGLPSGAADGRLRQERSAARGIPGAGAGAIHPLPRARTQLPPGVEVPWPPYNAQSQPEDATLVHLTANADGSVVFANGSSRDGKNPGVVFRTTDGGRTWHPVAASTFRSGRLLLPAGYPEQPTLFGINERTLYRSDDHGSSFDTVVIASDAAALSPAFSGGDPRIVFHLSLSQLADYNAADDSVSPRVSPLLATTVGSIVFRQAFPGDDMLLLGVKVGTNLDADRGAVYRCDSTRCIEAPPLSGSKAPPALLVSRSVPGATFATVPNAVYRSNDSGATFTQLPVPPQLTVVAVVDGAPGEIFLLGSNIRIPSAPSGVYRSTDGGASWIPVGVGTPLQQGAWSLIALPNGRLLATPMYSSGLLCSADNGTTWAARCT